MRKSVSLIAVFLLAGLLAGCGQEPEVTNSNLSEMNVDKYVTLGDYSNISISVEPVEVQQSQWDELTLAVYQSYVTAENGGVTNRAVEEGDIVIIDYAGKKDGVAFEGGTASNANLTIGSGRFIDGFEEGLIGVIPGETVDLNLAFPDDFRNEELAGQPVVFTVTVHFILPAADEMVDSVVAALGVPDVSTVEELRQYVYDYLQESADAGYRYQVQNALMEELLSQCVVDELPESFVDSYHDGIYNSLANVAAGYGVDAETYANTMGMTSEDYVSHFSLLQARQDVLLQAIAIKEQLTVSDEELQEKLEAEAAAAGTTIEELLGSYDREEYRNYVMSEKVMDFLIEKADITTP